MSRKIPIQVQIRARPHKSSDGAHSSEGLMGVTSNSVSAYHKGREHLYHFDRCHGPDCTQQDIFDGVMPVLEDALNGKNAFVFTYGVTGSGKTHTIQGTSSDAGLVPRVMRAIFDRQRDLAPEQNLEVSFSYVEILKEKLWDLLEARESTVELKMYTDGDGHTTIPGKRILPLEGTDHFMTAYSDATRNRTTAATILNSASSRSHAILSIYISVRNHQGIFMRRSKISLCDLAGSENNNLTGNVKGRMQESAAINQSLTTLGKVIKQINRLNGVKGHIPFRESKLTRILSDALGGSSIGLLLCCLAPGQKFAVDTINTLKFAAEAKLVIDKVATSGTGIGRQSLPVRSSQIPRAPMAQPEPLRRHTMPKALHTTGVLRPLMNGVSAPSGTGRPNQNPNKENMLQVSGHTLLKPGVPNVLVSRLQAELADANVQVHELKEEVKTLKAENGELIRRSAQSSPQPLCDVDIAALSAEEREARMGALYKAAKQYQADDKISLARDAYLTMAGYLVNDHHKHQEVLQRAAKLNLQLEGSLPITPGPPGAKRSRDQHIPQQRS